MNKKDLVKKCECGCKKEFHSSLNSEVICIYCSGLFSENCSIITLYVKEGIYDGICYLCYKDYKPCIDGLIIPKFYNPKDLCCYIYHLNILKHSFQLTIPILQCIQSYLN